MTTTTFPPIAATRNDTPARPAASAGTSRRWTWADAVAPLSFCGLVLIAIALIALRVWRFMPASFHSGG